MPNYHLHEGLLCVPAGWRDQSMNVFRLPGKNSNKDAAIILTRDYETPLATAAEYADAQQEAARKSFPGYRQIERIEAQIDGQPAAVVDYQWRSNGSALLRQRQLYVRHQSVMLTLTASAMADEFAQIDEMWPTLLASFKLFEREIEVPMTAETAVASALPHVFALSARDRQLHVFAAAHDACHQIDPLEVEDDGWVFFASSGMPLKPHFIKPNRRSMLRIERGFYELAPDTAGVSLPLMKRMSGVTIAQGAAPFETLEQINSHLLATALPADALA
ncbi:MAG: DcrB-related protein [Stenotrophomonas sp.]|uniref:DcrB-related protein n=1 Tax=Stenotrophomonas sp. TaxID=69392 RepID=UPI003D6D5B0A